MTTQTTTEGDERCDICLYDAMHHGRCEECNARQCESCDVHFAVPDAFGEGPTHCADCDDGKREDAEDARRDR